MARQRFDMGSKWLLRNQARAALLVGGIERVRSVEPLPGEIIQSRRLPDGLLRAFFHGSREPHLVLVEVATHAENRARQQALGDLTLAYNALGELPDLLMLVLRPKGNLQIGGTHKIQSKLGLSRLEATWKTVELWTLSATEFLAKGDAGVVPWVPLMHFDGPPEVLLEKCAQKIKRESDSRDKADLLAITEVLGGLIFPPALLAELLEGERTMIESPVLQKWRAQAVHEAILGLLKHRFGSVPRDVTKQLREILDEKKLRELTVNAAECSDVQVFREMLV